MLSLEKQNNFPTKINAGWKYFQTCMYLRVHVGRPQMLGSFSGSVKLKQCFKQWTVLEESSEGVYATHFLRTGYLTSFNIIDFLTLLFVCLLVCHQSFDSFDVVLHYSNTSQCITPGSIATAKLPHADLCQMSARKIRMIDDGSDHGRRRHEL